MQPIQRVAIVGAGNMGSGIAQKSAQEEFDGLSDDTTAKNNTSERITETAESSKKSIDDSALDIPAFLRR